MDGKFFETVASIYTSSIDRSRKNAEIVLTAAGALATLYTGVLGVAFSVTDQPLPQRGIWPAVFFGLAIVFATAYLSFWTSVASLRREGPKDESHAQRIEYRQRQLARMTNATIIERITLLRVSVVALGLGASLVVLPFLDFDQPDPNASPMVEPTTDWTKQPDVSSEPDAELAAIRYAAQIEEDREARAAELRIKTVPRTWNMPVLGEVDLVIALVALAAGLLLITGVASAIQVHHVRRSNS